MREIKFRGKRLDNGEWIYGTFMEQYHSTKHGKRIDAIFYSDDYRTYRIHVDSETVGQFTGLRDKNGKEIYEEDIVKALKHNKSSSVNEIEWRNGVLWFGNWNWIEFQNIFREIIAIGNIHDNPELLGCDNLCTTPKS